MQERQIQEPREIASPGGAPAPSGTHGGGSNLWVPQRCCLIPSRQKGMTGNPTLRNKGDRRLLSSSKMPKLGSGASQAISPARAPKASPNYGHGTQRYPSRDSRMPILSQNPRGMGNNRKVQNAALPGPTRLGPEVSGSGQRWERSQRPKLCRRLKARAGLASTSTPSQLPAQAPQGFPPSTVALPHFHDVSERGKSHVLYSQFCCSAFTSPSVSPSQARFSSLLPPSP